MERGGKGEERGGGREGRGEGEGGGSLVSDSKECRGRKP